MESGRVYNTLRKDFDQRFTPKGNNLFVEPEKQRVSYSCIFLCICVNVKKIKVEKRLKKKLKRIKSHHQIKILIIKNKIYSKTFR